MKHGTTCKFCKKPITLEIDDSYMELGDPMKLIPLAACNRCADLRTMRRRIEEEMFEALIPLYRGGAKPKENDLARARERIVPLTKKYTALVADWLHKTAQWEESIVDSIMAEPAKWHSVLQQIWKMYQTETQTQIQT